MARWPEQCMKQVTHIVRGDHWEGDTYHVCAQHIEWAKCQRPTPSIVKRVAPCDATAGCVYVVEERTLRRRRAQVSS